MKKSILVVDDEKDITSSIKTVLDKHGYFTKTSNSGTEALKLIKSENFELVILDILMPEMSGTELLEKIRKDKKIHNQKVMFLSVIEPSEHGREMLKTLKPNDYMIKPVEIDILLKKIKKLIG